MPLKLFFIAILCGFTTSTFCQDNSEIVLLSNRINTIEQLLTPYRGSPVFIDLWASWCSPCKEEFRFASSLYHQLKKRNVKMLYVSIDKDSLDSNWKKDIYDFKLYGYHVKANKALRDEITTLIWGAADAFSIPHYLLFDERGNLLSKDILRPSNMDKLYKQIDEKLAQNVKGIN